MSAFTMDHLKDTGENMKVTSKEVRLNQNFQPVMVLTIELPLSLQYDPESCSDGVFYWALEDAILAFDKADKCSSTHEA